MKKTVKILHTADLHIGQKISKDAKSDFYKQKCKDLSINTLNRIVDIAISNAVDAIVFAGDTFHTKPSPSIFDLFINALQPLELSGIDIVIVCGNHDGYTHWKKYLHVLGTNYHVLADNKIDSYQLRDEQENPLCLISGTSLSSKNCMTDNVLKNFNVCNIDPLGKFNSHIGLLHIGASESNMTETIDMSRLSNSGFDYVALGHIHKPNTKFFGNTVVSYSGTPQGHDIGEVVRFSDSEKDAGYFVNLVTIVNSAEQNKTSVEQIPCTDLIFDDINVDVSYATDYDQILNSIIDTIDNVKQICNCQYMVCRISLVGPTLMHGWLTKRQNRDMLIENICSYCNIDCNCIYVKTSMIYDQEELLGLGGVPAEIIKHSNILKADTEIAENVIQCFIDNNSKIPIDPSVLNDDLVNSIINKAQNIAINSVTPEFEK